MFRIGMIAAILVSIAVPPASAQSQSPRSRSLMNREGIGLGINGSLYSNGALIREPQVLEELKPTDDQEARLEDFQKDRERARARIEEQFQNNMKELGEEPDPHRLAQLNKIRSTALLADANDAEEALRKILDPRQFTRLEQIRCQADGPFAFLRPDAQELFNLTPEQVEHIKTVVIQGHKNLVTASILPPQFLPDVRTTSPEQRRKIQESREYKATVKTIRESAVKVREETMQGIFKLLSKGQRERYQEIVGEPFDFSKAWGPPTSSTMESKQEAKAP